MLSCTLMEYEVAHLHPIEACTKTGCNCKVPSTQNMNMSPEKLAYIQIVLLRCTLYTKMTVPQKQPNLTTNRNRWIFQN